MQWFRISRMPRFLPFDNKESERRNFSAGAIEVAASLNAISRFPQFSSNIQKNDAPESS